MKISYLIDSDWIIDHSSTKTVFEVQPSTCPIFMPRGVTPLAGHDGLTRKKESLRN
jgi:hypothetical protein